MKIVKYAIVTWILVAASSVSIYQTASAVTAIIPIKTYSDFGLGFRVEYPSNLVLQKGVNNITFTYSQSLNKTGNFLFGINVYTWVKAVGLSGMFTPPSLDTLARHVGLGMSANTTITNKTKLTIDNTSAYLIQANMTRHGHTIHESVYLMLKGDIVYMLLFGYSDQAKFLPVEQKIMKSFRFI